MGKKHPNEIRIWKEIGSILWNDWDPIGVNDRETARDEYDDYIGGVYSLLQSGASIENIATHLEKTAEDAMGLNTVSEHSVMVAKKLKDVKLT